MSELWNLSPVESGLLAQRVDHTQQAATTALQGSERQDGNNGENNNRDKEVNGVPGVSAAGLQAEASDRGQSAREEEGTSANGVYSELALVLAPLASFFSVFEAAKPVKKVELLEKLPPDVLLKLKEVTTALQQAPGLAQQLQRHRPGLQQAGRGPAVTAGADGAAAAAYCGATSAPAGGEGIGTVGSDADVEDDDAGEGAEGEEAAGGAAKKTGKVPGKSRTNRQKAARAANYYAENAIKKFEYKVPKKHKEAGKGPLAVIAAAADPVRGTASYGVGVHPASILIELRATTLAAAVAKYTPGMSVMGVVEKIMLSALAIVNPLEGTELDAATIRERFGSLQQRWSRDWVRYLAGAFGGLLNNVQQCLPQLLQRVVRPRRPATAATQVAAAAVAAAPVGAPEQQQAAHMAAAVDSGGPGAAATAVQAEVAGAAAAAGSSQVPGGGAGAPGARTLAVSAGRQVAAAAEEQEAVAALEEALARYEEDAMLHLTNSSKAAEMKNKLAGIINIVSEVWILKLVFWDYCNEQYMVGADVPDSVQMKRNLLPQLQDLLIVPGHDPGSALSALRSIKPTAGRGSKGGKATAVAGGVAAAAGGEGPAAAGGLGAEAAAGIAAGVSAADAGGHVIAGASRPLGRRTRAREATAGAVGGAAVAGAEAGPTRHSERLQACGRGAAPAAACASGRKRAHEDEDQSRVLPEPQHAAAAAKAATGTAEQGLDGEAAMVQEDGQGPEQCMPRLATGTEGGAGYDGHGGYEAHNAQAAVEHEAPHVPPSTHPGPMRTSSDKAILLPRGLKRNPVSMGAADAHIQQMLALHVPPFAAAGVPVLSAGSEPSTSGSSRHTVRSNKRARTDDQQQDPDAQQHARPMETIPEEGGVDQPLAAGLVTQRYLPLHQIKKKVMPTAATLEKARKAKERRERRNLQLADHAPSTGHYSTRQTTSKAARSQQQASQVQEQGGVVDQPLHGAAAAVSGAAGSSGPGAAATAAQAEVAGAAAAAGSSQVPGGGAGAPGARTLAVSAGRQVAAAAEEQEAVGAPEQQQAAHMAAAVDSGGPGAAATAAQAEVAGAAAAAGSSQVPGGGAGAPGARTLAVSAGRQVAAAATYTAGGGGPDGRGGSDASHREPMDGNEIWELNKRLGQLAERLADPADLEPQPKRKKSLTLQEKCHNAWGVKGYAGRLDELYGGDDTLDDTTLPDYIPFTLLAESGEGGDDDDDALLGQGLRGGLAGLAGDNGGSAGAPLGLGDGDRSGARPGPSPGTPSSSSGSGSRDSRGNRTVMDLVSDAEAEEVAPAAGFEAVYQGFGSNDGFVDFEDDVQVTTRCAVGGILRATLDAADPGARQAFCRVFEKGGLTEVLVKYEPNSATRLALSRSVLQRFKRGAMINDEVVTLYKHLLQDRDTREQKRHIATAAAAAAAAAGAAASDAQAASAAAVADVVAKGAPPAGSSSTQGCHFFGPNFYDKLFKDNVKKGKRGGGTGSSDGGTGNGDGGTGNGDGGAGKGHGHFVYKNVKEWTSAPRLKVAGQIYFRQSVLERRHIFIPVHLDLHWVCVEVYLAPDVASSELRCYDPLMRTETDQRAKDAQEVLQNVAVWVESEAKAKMAKDLRLEPQWQATRWRRVFIASPKQRSDSNNCAIFMLAYMNRRSAGLEPNHSEEDADRLRIEMVYSLMQRCIS